MLARLQVRGPLVLIFCVVIMSNVLWAQDLRQRLIQGVEVNPNDYKEVVKITSEKASNCTATVIGPRVIVTAATCAKAGTQVSFSVGGANYKAQMTPSSLFPAQDHDMALGLLSAPINGVTPATVGKEATVGLSISLLGYGCTQPGGGGAIDGKLRKGETTVTEFNNFDMISRRANGAVMCFGDQGGPSYVIEGNKKFLLGVNSKGNLTDKNYSVRLSLPESQSFFKKFAQDNGVEICGINKDCGGGPGPDPDPDAPSCTLSANPPQIHLGESITIKLSPKGQVTSAEIDGSPVMAPSWQKIFTPLTAGQQMSIAKVVGPGGGVGSCQVTFSVTGTSPPTSPSCSIMATPTFVKLGQKVTLTLKTQGDVNAAAIDGISADFPTGTREFTPIKEGSYFAWGAVLGQGGSGACRTEYSVGLEPPPPPEPPNFTLVLTHCGNNTLESKVMQVCLAKVKRSILLQQMIIQDVVFIIYDDNTREILPVIHRKPRIDTKTPSQLTEDIVFYANSLIKMHPYTLMDTRVGTLYSFRGASQAPTPTRLEGKSAQGHAFVVVQFDEETKKFIH